MKKAFIAAALLISGAAVAQEYPVTTTTTTTTSDGTVIESTETVATPMAVVTPASGAIVAPSNANPEHDARGIAVISDPAVVPAGFNGVTASAMGGPLLDPVTGEEVVAAETSYPACTAEITDNCLQTYERGRSPQ